MHHRRTARPASPAQPLEVLAHAIQRLGVNCDSRTCSAFLAGLGGLDRSDGGQIGSRPSSATHRANYTPAWAREAMGMASKRGTCHAFRLAAKRTHRAIRAAANSPEPRAPETIVPNALEEASMATRPAERAGLARSFNPMTGAQTSACHAQQRLVHDSEPPAALQAPYICTKLPAAARGRPT